MRKILLGLISILLVAFAIYIVIYGIEWGDFKISAIPTIQEENEFLDRKIAEATKLKTQDYPEKTSLLEKAYKNLITEKESYTQLIELGVDENGLPINKIQEYEIEKIWVTMGNYAKKQGVDLKMDVTSNNSISKTYDLEFSVTGGYIQITDFLYDVERDSTLVFKLDNFKMVPGTNTENLLATFTCKDIKLNISGINNATTEKDSKEDKESKEDDKKNETSKEKEDDKKNETSKEKEDTNQKETSDDKKETNTTKKDS